MDRDEAWHAGRPRRCSFVCLLATLHKNVRTSIKFSGTVDNGPTNKTNDKIFVAIDLDRDTGKTCLGGGMHCPSASSFVK